MGFLSLKSQDRTIKEKDKLVVNEKSKKLLDYNEIIDNILGEFIVNRPHLINAVERGIKKKEELESEILLYLKLQGIILDEIDSRELLHMFEQYVWGYGTLQELIDDKDISDIKVISHDNIRVKVKGKRRKSHVTFQDEESLKRYVNYISIKNNAILSEINAIQKFTDKKSSEDFILRINISSELINSSGIPCLVIRKIPKNKLSIYDLENMDMFNYEIREYLETAIRSGLSIFCTGKGASGKTTLMNAMLEEIPHDKSSLVIQEAEELFTVNHPDIVFQKVKFTSGDSQIEYTLRDLSINGLLMDLDYFIIGEIKGGEAYDMANAIYTGHTGMASVHGSSSEEAVNKIVHYMKYVSDMKKGELLEMLSNIDVMIFMKDFRVMEVAEIAGYDYDKECLIFNRVFQYDIHKSDNGYEGKFIKVNDSCEKVNKKILYSSYINSERNKEMV